MLLISGEVPLWGRLLCRSLYAFWSYAQRRSCSVYVSFRSWGEPLCVAGTTSRGAGPCRRALGPILLTLSTWRRLVQAMKFAGGCPELSPAVCGLTGLASE